MSIHDQALAEISARVLEALCFHWVDPESLADGHVERTCAEVSFRGPFCGRMFVAVEPALLAEFAESLLGDDGASGQESELALLEIANVLCGNALPELDSPQSAFELGSPAIVRGNPPCESMAFASAVLDAGRIMVQVVKEPS